jgi:mannose-6-phosphate isomerase-like protein (cupin superfamily)
VIAEQRPVVLQPHEGVTVAVGPTTVRFLAIGADTAGRSSSEEIGVPAGFGGPPPHIHTRTDHSWYVTEGRLRLTLAGVAHDVGPGAFLHVPRRTAHTFANPGTEFARMVEFTVPSGFDSYLRELAEAFPAGTAIEPARMIEIMARHDTFPTES